MQMTITPEEARTMTAAAAISEARSYGLDVEAERCDIAWLVSELRLLRHVDPTVRPLLIEKMNEGWSVAQAAAQLDAEQVKA